MWPQCYYYGTLLDRIILYIYGIKCFKDRRLYVPYSLDTTKYGNQNGAYIIHGEGAYFYVEAYKQCQLKKDDFLVLNDGPLCHSGHVLCTYMRNSVSCAHGVLTITLIVKSENGHGLWSGSLQNSCHTDS